MRLYNVVQVVQPSRLSNKSECRPECREIVVLKETPLYYLVDSSFVSYHGSQIKKGNLGTISFNPVQAWSKYIARTESVIAAIQRELKTHSESYLYARWKLEEAEKAEKQTHSEERKEG